ncbi:amino acid adenylation domain-containing protein [Anabaena sp. UHCC 0451]|uniref:amino acid adenylation domain-containing protein n=1 Tax=Anabaena sp. UHCC 0451 TaxID=2055235 RepID=UPI002B22110E|nr:amino acid adenylation domain-containing protein [Anabaena sp. UHCC 0451]MEA5577738.1 amino acid adenylation domain-containing protein [Anabaena sp. UHCC 0451]
MNSIQVLLEELQAQNIQLWVEEDRLRYRCPNNALTPELKGQLSAQKSEIIAFLRQQQRVETIPIAEDDFVPLSFAQQRLWFLDQLEPNLAVYNIPLALRLQGNLNISALEKSLEKIVERHSVLRTNFPTIDGQPYQNIVSESTLSLPVVDLQHLNSATSEAEIQDILVQFINEPFDLAGGKVLRNKLFHISASEYILVTVVHHIAFDAWSSRIWWQELMSFYQAFALDLSISLPELPIQYKDFAVWQKSRLQGDFLAQQLNYWREKLGDAPQNLDLLTDNPRPPVQTHTGDRQYFYLSSSQVAALKQLGLLEGATLYMTLLTAFAILLYRYSGQEDFLIGSPIANRNYTEIENLIGFFVNTLALRINLAKDITFLELLQQVRDTTLEAYSHQDIPFEKLVEELQPQRDRSRHPLFQVMFSLQNVPRATLNLPDLKVSLFPVSTNTTKFDITVILEETNAGLKCFVNYNNHLFVDTTIQSLIAHYQTLLTAIIAQPTAKVTRLQFLSSEEEKQMIFLWNETQTDYPRDQTVSSLFEQQVEKNPQAVAFLEPKITYQELNQQANQLAHYLQSQGVGVGERVGIYLQNSLDFVVTALAILKVGAVYVPLDPNYPQQRLEFMLSDADITVLVTCQHFSSDFVGVNRIYLDADAEVIATQAINNLPQLATATSCAYIIYTSGSTGTPKGVIVPHRAISRLVVNTNYIEIQKGDGETPTVGDRIAQASNLSFDAATFEIWGAMLNGATLVEINRETLLSPSNLAEKIKDSQISILFLTTALFEKLTWEIPDAFASLKYLLFGGESVAPASVTRILEQGKPQHLLHVYGPTENTTFSIWYPVESLSENTKNLPIGRAIANTEVYILDQYQQPVPVGVPGEIYLGGDGLAQGYLNRAELTAEKFVFHPWSNQLTAQLYRTGDLGRYLPDGNVEFLGRIDRQIKIRGFRIEPQEIEACLCQHPQIREALIKKCQLSTDDERLVAYIIPYEQQQLINEEARSFVEKQLPSYMIPTYFVQLSAFPLTVNGKINHEALPLPELDKQRISETFIPSRNDIERQLTEIWEEVFNVKPIGIKDDFFALGGHSLLTVSLVAKIETLLSKKLPISALFELTTIAQLAHYLEHEEVSDHIPSDSNIHNYQLSVEEEKALLAITLGRPGERPQPNSFMVKIHSRGNPEKPFFYCANAYKEAVPLANLLECPFFLLESGYNVFSSDNTYAIKALAARHLKDILTVQPQGSYSIGGYSYGALVAYEISQQLQARGKTVDLLVIFDRPGTHFLYVLYRYCQNLYSHISLILSTFKQLKPKERWQYLRQKGLRILRNLGLNQILGQQPSSEERERKPSVETLSSLVLTASHYQFSPYDGRVALFCADERRKAPLWLFPRSGWDKKTLPKLEVYEVPGNHYTMIKDPHVRVLAKQLETCLIKSRPV